MRVMVMTVAALSLAGCAHSRMENQALTQFPGAQAQIQSFYDDNATEDDWYCNEVEMDTIDQTRLVSQTDGQVRLAVTYFFTSFDESSRRGGEQCQGFNTRFFTFDRSSSGGLTLVAMSGPQRQS
jgi:hypothetical protein